MTPDRAILLVAWLLVSCVRGAPPVAAQSVTAKPAGPRQAHVALADPPAEQRDPVNSCSAALTGYVIRAPRNVIAAARPVQPFYQWQTNNGYCGEVSLLQAGLNNGLWASQYHMRLLCGHQGQGDEGIALGTPLQQSGPPGHCAAHRDKEGVEIAAHGAQLLLDSGQASKGANSVVTCANNAGLALQSYVQPAQLRGKAALRHFILWIKQQLLAGHAVTIGVLAKDGSQTEYDHIVSVHSVGTSHAPTDAGYYEDDVLYLEDHGTYTFSGGGPANNPAIPPGAVARGEVPPLRGLKTDPKGCVPYVFGIRMADLGHTRKSFDALTTGQPYALALPERGSAEGGSAEGGSAERARVEVGSDEGDLFNYGVAVTGPLDKDGVTRPVSVRIAQASVKGVALPRDPIAGFHYEAPYIGDDDDGDSCTNDPPAAWMDLQLRVEVAGLVPGNRYVLYRYVFDGVRAPAGASPVGTKVALAIPHDNFNARRAQASAATPITAVGTTHVELVAARSNQVVAFRAVPADAP